MHQKLLNEDQIKFLLSDISRFGVGDIQRSYTLASLHSARTLHHELRPKWSNKLPFFCGAGFILGLTFRTSWAMPNSFCCHTSLWSGSAFSLLYFAFLAHLRLWMWDSEILPGWAVLAFPSGITFSWVLIYPQTNSAVPLYSECFSVCCAFHGVAKRCQ